MQKMNDRKKIVSVRFREKQMAPDRDTTRAELPSLQALGEDAEGQLPIDKSSLKPSEIPVEFRIQSLRRQRYKCRTQASVEGVRQQIGPSGLRNQLE